METKRATIKDVAKLAGVGVTTVSYVINGRDKEMRVSEATKKKVLQVANVLNYSPNPLAAGLKTNSARFVVVRAGRGSGSGGGSGTFQNLELMSLLDDLNTVMQQNGYSLSYSPGKSAEKLSAEACVCFNMSREEFMALGDENYIPLIALDCMIDDPIYYQVNTDFAKIKAAADVHFRGEYDYVAVGTANEALREEILEVFPNTVFVSELYDIESLTLSGRVLLSQSSLFRAFESAGKTMDIFRYDAHLAVRPQVVFDCIRNAVNRIPADKAEHFARI